MTVSFSEDLGFKRWEVDLAMAKHTCPVCGRYQFEAWNDVCDWCNDGVQESEPNYRGGANRMSLNEAKEAYKEGRQIR